MELKLDSRIPSTHSSVEKALLLAHLLNEDGHADWAIIIYEVLIMLEDTSAMTHLANVLSAPPKYLDVPRAKKLYREACAKGEFSACYNLAVLYQDLGDSASAQRYLRMAKSRASPQDNDDLMS
jgi:hypothetical protein